MDPEEEDAVSAGQATRAAYIAARTAAAVSSSPAIGNFVP
jgi:hypothetical protein